LSRFRVPRAKLGLVAAARERWIAREAGVSPSVPAVSRAEGLQSAPGKQAGDLDSRAAAMASSSPGAGMVPLGRPFASGPYPRLFEPSAQRWRWPR